MQEITSPYVDNGIRKYVSPNGHHYVHIGDLAQTLREVSAQADALTNLTLPKIIAYIEGLGDRG